MRNIALISECKLIFKVNKSVVDRCCRKHKHLRFHTGTNNPIEQFQITVFLCILAGHLAAVAEVVALINNNKVIVAPIQAVKINSVRLSVFAGKVRMVEDVVSQPIRCNGIVDIVTLVCVPVFRELFGAEDKHGFVAVLIVLDHRKRSKRLAETNAVCQNAAIEFFEFADDGKNRVTLEVIKHSPDFAFLKARCFVRQLVLRNVIKELFENVIECNKIDILRRILTIRRRDIFDHNIRDLLQLFLVVP